MDAMSNAILKAQQEAERRKKEREREAQMRATPSLDLMMSQGPGGGPAKAPPPKPTSKPPTVTLTGDTDTKPREPEKPLVSLTGDVGLPTVRPPDDEKEKKPKPQRPQFESSFSQEIGLSTDRPMTSVAPISMGGGIGEQQTVGSMLPTGPTAGQIGPQTFGRPPQEEPGIRPMNWLPLFDQPGPLERPEREQGPMMGVDAQVPDWQKPIRDWATQGDPNWTGDLNQWLEDEEYTTPFGTGISFAYADEQGRRGMEQRQEGAGAQYTYAMQERRRKAIDEGRAMFSGTPLSWLDEVLDSSVSFMDWNLVAPGIEIANNIDLPLSGGLIDIPGLTPEVQREEYSLGQVISTVGTVLNQSFNPFSPTFKYDNQWREVGMEEFVDDIGSALQDNINAWYALNNWYDNLSPEQKVIAEAGLSNTISGALRTGQTMREMVYKEDKERELEEQLAILDRHIQMAQAAGDEETAKEYRHHAAGLRNQLEDSRNLTTADIIDKYANPWAEFLWGAVVDPTNLLPLGAIPDLIRLAKARAIFNVSDDVAKLRLERAMDDASKTLEKAVPGETFDIRSQWQRWWGATGGLDAQSKATEATEWLWSTGVQILNKADSKEEAKAILGMWTQNPYQLIDPNGPVRIGAGVIANKRVLEHQPVLLRAADDFANMKSLAGEGPLSHVEMLAELDDVLFKAAEMTYGIKPLDLPVGATNFKLRRQKDGTGVIEFFDKDKKVIHTTTPKVYYDASVDYKELKAAVKDKGGRMRGNVVEMFSNTQRAILSDLWLNQSPRHWVRNAASAYMHLVADGLYSKESADAILGRWFGRLGTAPTRRLAEGQSGMEGSFRSHWAENIPVVGKPYADLMGRLNRIWTDRTEIPTGAGTSIPVGEQAFRLKAFSAASERILQGGWQDTVQEGFRNQILQMGVDPVVADSIASRLVEAGVTGNRQTVEATIRAITGGDFLAPSLADFDVPWGLLDPESYRDISKVLASANPMNMEETLSNLRRAFHDQIERRAKVINTAPPGIFVPEWTNQVGHEDAGLFYDAFEELAQRHGFSFNDLRPRAKKMAQRWGDEGEALWDSFRADMAQSADPSVVHVGLDTWFQMTELRKQARKELDGLLQKRVQKDQWEGVLSQMDSIHENYHRQIEDVFVQGRENIRLANQGQAYKPLFSAAEIIEDYIKLDEDALQVMLSQGKKLRSQLDKKWSVAKEGARGLIDKSTYELFDAFKLNPTQEALDLIVETQRVMGRMGHQVASYLKPFRDAAINNGKEDGRLWDAFFRRRNEAWQSWTENVVALNKGMRQMISASSMRSGDLSWLHWIGEGEKAQNMWLVGKAEGGRYYVSTDTGYRIMAESEIPPGVLEMYNKISPGKADTVPLPKEKLEGLDFFGLEPGEDLLAFLSENIGKSLKTGGTKHPEIGEILGLDIEELTSLWRKISTRLPELAGSPRPHNLDPRTRQAVADLGRTLAQSYDDVLAMAIHGGEEAADFAMLNYGRRRGFDYYMSIAFPFHYYWSRTGLNWIRRAIQKPQIVNFAHEYQRAKDIENRQSGVDQSLRYKGTWPNPLNRFGIGPERMRDPAEYLLPWRMYMPNEFVPAEEASTEAGKWILRVAQWVPSPQPMLQASLMASMDKIAPRTDGVSWLASFQAGDYAPWINLAGYSYQYATGEPPPGGFLTWGDEFDNGRIDKQIAMGEGNEADKLWAQDLNRQRIYGLGPLPEESPEAKGLYRAGVKAAAGDRLWSLVPNFLFGVGLVPYPEEERRLREQNRERQRLGYDEELQPYGGQDLRSSEGLRPWWHYTDTYPGNEPTTEDTRPGMTAVRMERKEAKEEWDARIQEQMNAYVGTGERITTAEMRAERDRLEAERDADLQQRYPSYFPLGGTPPVQAQAGETVEPTAAATTAAAAAPAEPGREIDFLSGANPREVARRAYEQAVWAAWKDVEELKPPIEEKPDVANKPGKNAPQAEWDAYNGAWDAYNAKWDAYNQAFEERVQTYLSDPDMLSGLVGGRPVDLSLIDTKSDPREIISDVFQQNMGDEEREAYRERGALEERVSEQWDEYNKLTTAQKREFLRANPEFAEEYLAGGRDAWWLKPPSEASQKFLAARDFISEQFGPEDAKLFAAYHSLDKGEARKEFSAKNPRISMLLIAGYNPEEYAQATEMFGEDAWEAWINLPEWEDTDEARFRRNEYWAANPNAKKLNAWLYGRSINYDPDKPGSNFGKDYETAQQMFGENIFDLFAQYNVNWSRQEKAQWFNRYPHFSDFQAWWYEGSGDGTTRSSGPSTYRSADGLVTYDRWGRRLDSLGNVARGGWGGGGGRRSWVPRTEAPSTSMTTVKPSGYGYGDYEGSRAPRWVRESEQIKALSSRWTNRSWT